MLLFCRHNAKDEDSTALNIAIQNSDEHIMCRILTIKSYPDPDFKINKKAVPIDTELRPSTSNHTYSSLFPNTATMINWHSSNGSLPVVHMTWLSEATLSCNPKLKDHPQAHTLCLAAITRIDLSHNQIKTIPIELFNLASIRILNVAQNKIESLPMPKDSGEYYAPVLEELYLQDNRLDQVPKNIFRLPNLQTVDVSNNKLQNLPYELWLSPRLRELNVAFNLLKDLPSLPKVFLNTYLYV